MRSREACWRAVGLLLLAELAQCMLPAQPPVRDLRVQPAARRTALIVGNDSYAKWPLKNSVNDARDMAAALSQIGFAADLLVDADLRTLEKAVDRFVVGVRPGDVALFFYAGHGLQLFGDNYLVPVDFDAKDEADAKYSSYAASRIQDRMENAGARLSVVVLDACRNNPFRSSRSTGGGLATMSSGRGTLIAFATSPGKTASDNSFGRNGLFTAHLISVLREPGLSLEEVFTRVRERVYEASNQEQLPWTVSSVIGTFVLNSGQQVSDATGRSASASYIAQATHALLAPGSDVAAHPDLAPVPSRLPNRHDLMQAFAQGRRNSSVPVYGSTRVPEREQSSPASSVELFVSATGWLRAGTLVRVRTISRLSSASNRPAGVFAATLETALVQGDRVIAGKGTDVEGRVVSIDAGGRVRGRAYISIHLTRLKTAGDRWVDISTNVITCEAPAAKANDAAKIAYASSLGAAIGALAAGRKGAAIGAAAGGGAGAAQVVATRGAAAVIPAETVLEFRLLVPVAIAAIGF